MANESVWTQVSPFIKCQEVKEDVSIRIFCFPYAGGNEMAFDGWHQLFPDNVEIYCVRFTEEPRVEKRKTRNPDLVEMRHAGSRAVKDQTRISLKRASSMHGDADAFSEALAQQVAPFLNVPYVLFGMGVGGLYAFEVANRLASHSLSRPLRLVMVNAPAPARAHYMRKAAMGMDDETLFSDLAQLGHPLFRVPIKNANESSVLRYRRDVDRLQYYMLDERNYNLRCPATLYSTETEVQNMGISGIEWEKLFKKTDHTVFDMQWSSSKNLYYPWYPEERGAFFQDLLSQLQGDLDKNLADSLNIMDEWNSHIMDYPRDKCLHELFVEQVSKTPNKTAVVDGGRSMTYAELDNATTVLANYLYESGIRPNEVGGIFMERSMEYAIAYLAILKAGGGYMPMEIVYPKELVERVCREAKPPCVLTFTHHSKKLPSWQKQLIMEGDWLENIRKTAPPMPEDRPKPTPDDTAYTVLSSGTTGVPKGIVCPHRGAVHSYNWRYVHYPYDEGEREACNIFFVWEVIRPLLRGSTSYVIPDTDIYDPQKVVDFIQGNDITRILFTPSMAELIVEVIPTEELSKKMSSLKIVWLCGEVVTIRLRDALLNAMPGVKLLNLYSISECHDVSVCDLNNMDSKVSVKYASCGHVMENVRVYILDDNLQRVPLGVAGELYVGGPCLAKGYLNMPEKTAERFVRNPFYDPEDPQSRLLYRTGDRGRLLPNGELELIGRCDFMVKIRGYSVVLGAVEVALCEHPKISSAVVVTHGNEGEDKKLVAYVVPESWDDQPNVADVKRFMKDKVPHYAIPSVFMDIPALPIHPASGKLDRKQLPKIENLDLGSSRMNTDVAATTATNSMLTGKPLRHEDTAEVLENKVALRQPQERDLSHIPNVIERLIRGVWGDLLEVNAAQLHHDANFFDNGGHSLLSVRMLNRLTNLFGEECKIPVAEFVKSPTLDFLVDQVENLQPAEITIRKCYGNVLRQDPLKLDTNASFFDLGGHSLAASRLVIELNKTFKGLNLETAAFMKQSSVSEVLYTVLALRVAKSPELRASIEMRSPKRLASGPTSPWLASTGPRISNGVSREAPLDLFREVFLDPAIYPAATRKTGYARLRVRDATKPPQRVLLTGGTGFLGAFLIYYLLCDTQCMLFCLVRAEDPDEGFRRLEKNLQHYQLLSKAEYFGFYDRVIPVCGNLDQPLLGLSNVEWKSLAGEVDAIIHNGAAVNLVKPYTSLKATNVLGTQEILRLAVTNGMFDVGATRVKPVFYVSTNGVFPTGYGKCMEDDPMGHWEDLEDGYGQTKWVAEQICLRARERGLPVCIVRPGNLSGASFNGAWQDDDFMRLIMLGCMRTRTYPDDVNWGFDMTPVDWAAKALVHLACQSPGRALGRILHLQSPHTPTSSDQFFSMFKGNLATLKPVPYFDFRRRVSDEANDTANVLLLKLEAGLDSFSRYLASNIEFDSAEMKDALSKANIPCPEVDEELIRKYVMHITQTMNGIANGN